MSLSSAARHTEAGQDLPVVGWDNEYAWLLADLRQLADEGLVDLETLRARLGPCGEIPAEFLEAMLEDLGMRGCAEEHIRKNGQVYRCPTWCNSDSHPRTGICLEEPAHIRHTGEIKTDYGSVSVAFESFESEGAIRLTFNGEEKHDVFLNRQQSQALGLLLQIASQVWDQGPES